MNAYFRQVQPNTWHATSSAGSFVAAVTRKPDGKWTVSADRTGTDVRLDDVGLEEAFGYINTYLIGEALVK